MTDPIQDHDSYDHYDGYDGGVMLADGMDDGEMPTNRLGSGNLVSLQQHTSGEQPSQSQQVDWLAALSSRRTTGHLTDGPPGRRAEPSGMLQHVAPPRMVPTLGARLTTALRRAALLTLLAALAVGLVAGAGYVLTSSPWFSGITVGPAPAEPVGEPDTVRPQPPPQVQPPTTAQESAPTTRDAADASNASPRELRDRGIEQYRKGSFVEAIVLLEASVATGSEDPIAYYQLGLAYLAAQDHEHALDDAELAFRTAISMQPEWAAPHQGMAESLLRRGFYEEAIASALEATRIEAESGAAWMTLGRAYEGAGRDAEATSAFAEAARHAPPPPLQP